jgi:hypothetical protein
MRVSQLRTVCSLKTIKPLLFLLERQFARDLANPPAFAGVPLIRLVRMRGIEELTLPA